MKKFRKNSTRLVHLKLQNMVEEIKEDLNEYEGIPCSWIRRIRIKRAIPTKLIYRCNATSIRIITYFFWQK